MAVLAVTAALAALLLPAAAGASAEQSRCQLQAAGGQTEGRATATRASDHVMLQVGHAHLSGAANTSKDGHDHPSSAGNPFAWSGTGPAVGGEWCEEQRPVEHFSLKHCHRKQLGIKVKVGSYNLFWWNLFGPTFQNGNGRSAGKLINASGTPIPYDFLGFQECDNVWQVLGDAELTGYGALTGYHSIAIAYRAKAWKVLASGQQDMAEDRPGLYGRRAVMWARFEHWVTGRTVFFANHHGPLPVGTGGLCGEQATAWGLLRVIGENAETGDVILLTGDFNAPGWTSEITELGKYLYKLHSGLSFGGVDHIFSSCGAHHVQERRRPGAGGSDHDLIDMVIKV